MEDEEALYELPDIEKVKVDTKRLYLEEPTDTFD
jgi:hypothetical protein